MWALMMVFATSTTTANDKGIDFLCMNKSISLRLP